MYKIENLTNRQFEVLAANYAKSIAPDYKWVLTKKVADFNRDFEFENDKSWKWGEAKRTDKPTTGVSKSRWDPTLLSAILKNNVDEIYLVTCGNIPLNYIVRAEHLKSSKIKKIFYINRFILDNWLNKFAQPPKLEMFNTDENIDLNKIITQDQQSYPQNQIITNFFDLVDTNLLEPVKKLTEDIFYELNITIFSLNNEAEIILELPDSFVCREINVTYLNPESSFDNISKTVNERMFHLHTLTVCQGYSQIRLIGFFTAANKYVNYRVYFKDDVPPFSKIFIKKKSSVNKEKIKEIALFERCFSNCKADKANFVLQVGSISNEDLNRHFKKGDNFGGLYYYKFCGNSNLDSNVLCLLATKLLLNINLQEVSQNNIWDILNSSIEFCDFELSDIAIGCINQLFANSAISNFSINDNKKLLKTQIDDCSIFFIEGVEQLTREQMIFFNALKNDFRIGNNASILIEKRNNATTVYYKKVAELTDIKYLIDKAERFYNATDFYSALFYFNQIKKMSKSLSLKQIFEYADCLNHCGSMQNSKEQFEMVINLGDKSKEYELKLMNEAQTEIFNIRFWQMDIKNLVSDIESFLRENAISLKAYKKFDRELYCYYNLLNRKMVTLYMQGKYDEANSLYKFILSETNESYQNYLAFAHMDSARGLYSKDIKEAYKRLKCAKTILSKLNDSNKEKRRYLDCLVEIEYVRFIINFTNNKTV